MDVSVFKIIKETEAEEGSILPSYPSSASVSLMILNTFIGSSITLCSLTASTMMLIRLSCRSVMPPRFRSLDRPEPAADSSSSGATNETYTGHRRYILDCQISLPEKLHSPKCPF